MLLSEYVTPKKDYIFQFFRELNNSLFSEDKYKFSIKIKNSLGIEICILNGNSTDFLALVESLYSFELYIGSIYGDSFTFNSIYNTKYILSYYVLSHEFSEYEDLSFLPVYFIINEINPINNNSATRVLFNIELDDLHDFINHFVNLFDNISDYNNMLRLVELSEFI